MGMSGRSASFHRWRNLGRQYGPTGLGWVALQHIGTGEAKMRDCTDGFVDYNSAMVEDFLELDGGLAALMWTVATVCKELPRNAKARATL
jgi:hypothetical protein